jgi:predicted ATP-dependent serine protease
MTMLFGDITRCRKCGRSNEQFRHRCKACSAFLTHEGAEGGSAADDKADHDIKLRKETA